MRDLLAQSLRDTFVGRTKELETLATLLNDKPRIIFIHGIAGVGKSTLLSVFVEWARTNGAAVIGLDCRSLEPTERGFLQALSSAIGGPVGSLRQASARFESLGQRVLVCLDNYEVFRLMDSWLRQVFIPAMPDNVRLVIAGRDTPLHSWLTAPGWHELVRTIPLNSLSEADAIKLLTNSGATESDAKLINRFALGHPLALRLASVIAIDGDGTTTLPDTGFQRVFEELVKLYLDDVPDPITRRALDAASVVRRITVSLLQAMLPDVAPQDAFERLRALPFVENENDGLRLHDLVHQSVATSLQSTDPKSYQEYRRAAWMQLSTEVRRSGQIGLWRYTADLLYMIANPVVREAFFPSGATRIIVEPALDSDGPAILEISRKHDGARAADVIEMWWNHIPNGFHVVRDHSSEVAGFYLMFDPSRIDPSLLARDPVVEYWWNHVKADPVAENQRVLFLRRWLSREDGEKPCSVQATCWLDIKRTYMEMRPLLRRVYLTLNDLNPYSAVAQKLCFDVLDGEIELSGSKYASAMLDLGPSSVDGWLARLGAQELGVEEEMVDEQSHELLLDGKRVKLTKLEFAVFQYLYDRKGRAVSRASLIEDVWGWKHTGSNVVEAVMRTLRKKLGDRATLIETIRGLGYRFRRV